MKCKISCPTHKEDFREFEITPEGRVWPCCYYANAWEKRVLNNDEAKSFRKDGIWEVMKNDPNFNHLDHYTLKEIIHTPYYQEQCFIPGWESDNPPHICELNCGEKYDEALGKHVPGSLLEANQQIRGNND
tara:strand:- start:3603 stop:3995 length:393 start_codon:yes stop_codon:yes gene_type:complete